MFETIREYALERLEALGDLGAMRRIHAEYYLTMAQVAELQLAGDDRKSWMDKLERDHGNLQATLVWASEQNDPIMQASLAGALSKFWQARGHLREGRYWLDNVLKRDSSYAEEGVALTVNKRAPLPLDLRIKMLIAAANLAAADLDCVAAAPL